MSEDFSKHDHISTEEVEADLKETRGERDDIQAELDILNKRPAENKERFYVLRGRVTERNDLITFLNGLLKYRTSDRKIEIDISN